MSKWFKRQAPSNLPIKLLCFPYAGGTAQIYDGWNEHLNALGVEVIALQYPGRMERLSEPCVNNAKDIAQNVLSELLVDGLSENTLMVYGHSNGAIAAFEFAKQYEIQYKSTLNHVFLAARTIPKPEQKSRSLMSDMGLKKEIKALNGTPDELLNNAEFMDLILPSMRADFAIGENYKIPTGLKLSSPAHFIYGTQESITVEDANDWQLHFSNTLNISTLDAEHLFVNTHTQELIELLKNTIQRSRDSSHFMQSSQFEQPTRFGLDKIG